MAINCQKGSTIYYVPTGAQNVVLCVVVDTARPMRMGNDCFFQVINKGAQCGAWVPESRLFISRRDALAFADKESKSIVNSIKSEIKTMQDLVDFPLRHNIHSESGDDVARTAYLERAKELGFAG